MRIAGGGVGQSTRETARVDENDFEIAWAKSTKIYGRDGAGEARANDSN
jgi:hypothetical protein